MKKIVSIIAIISLVVFSYPQIIAYADAPIYELKTRTSTANYYDDSDLQSWSNSIISYGGTTPPIADVYSALSSYTNTEGYTTQLITLTSNNRLLVYEFDMNVIENLVFCRTSTDVKIYMYSNGSNSTPAIGRAQEYRFDTNVWLNKSDLIYDYWHDGRYISFNTQRLATLWAGVPYYYNQQILAVNGTIADNGYAQNFIEHIQDDYVDFLSVDLPYMGSDGSIIIPAPAQIELDKSVAFRKIDLSTIYSYTSRAHCAGLLAWELDPVGYSLIDENSAGWTMHYNIVVSYKWDTSMDNVVFRPFYNGGSASGTVAWDIEISPTGSIKANEQKFDIYDLMNTYHVSQGSSSDVANLGLAVYALKNGKGSVLGDLFGQSGQDITDISSAIGQANLFSINGYSANDISSIFTPTYTYALTHLDMQVVAYPVNNVTHIKGKPGTTKLNLVTNTNSSYAQGAEVTDSESGYDIVSPDYESSGDTVVTPVNNGSGSQVYVVINNPSSNSTGGGSSSSSSSSPSINIDNGGTISFDPGYRDLRNDVISSENDWGQYFLPFKDSNGVGEMFGSFLDNMPDELKAIFIGGFGILTCFAIYRFIRRG